MPMSMASVAVVAIFPSVVGNFVCYLYYANGQTPTGQCRTADCLVTAMLALSRIYMLYSKLYLDCPTKPD
eukprot:scaffold435676_cov20-Prasinocladus_malaysianus.AAC.1